MGFSQRPHAKDRIAGADEDQPLWQRAWGDVRSSCRDRKRFSPAPKAMMLLLGIACLLLTGLKSEVT